MIQLPPLSLYIHIPWCVKKCPYCDFNSHKLTGILPQQDYSNKLILDLQTHLLDFQGRVFQSVFIGGGTPSLFPIEALEKILDFLYLNNLTSRSSEITLEVNPGAIEHGSFDDYQTAGINRISLGVQSFQDEKLKTLGRIHNIQQIYQAVEKLKKSNFSNFNIDIMYGLPSQTLEDSIFDLNSAIRMDPTHISWYQLTIEPNTAFFIKPPILPDEDIMYEMENRGKSLLSTNGFHQYEVSSYSLSKNTQSKHNLNYWRFGDYVGIGSGAHSKVSYPNKNLITRYTKRKHPILYLREKKIPFTVKNIKAAELPYEFMLNAFRLKNGFNKYLFEYRTGLPLNYIEDNLDRARIERFIEITDTKIIPTDLGERYLNDLIQLFL